MSVRSSPLSTRALTAELRQVHADLRAANARIAELNLTVRAMALGLEAASGLGRVLVDQAPVFASPSHDVVGFPDFAHGEFDARRGEAGLVDELLDALAADAEQVADLSGSDEVVHGGKHSHEPTSHLTSAPG